ncbi:MAG: hypothetical protein GC149_13410 [Gammaproteobacteria bacterium]|nr:hypothetical protein [Gammaproteobacteria bacterium]
MNPLSHPPEEVVLASEMEGHITLQNRPAAGAKVVRKLSWNEGEKKIDSTSVDSEGKFLLPAKKDVVEIGKFTQFVVSQEISVVYDGKETDIWIMGKRSKTAYGELDGRPENFRCELSDPDKPMRLDSGLLLTKCKWDAITKMQGD